MTLNLQQSSKNAAIKVPPGMTAGRRSGWQIGAHSSVSLQKSISNQSDNVRINRRHDTLLHDVFSTSYSATMLVAAVTCLYCHAYCMEHSGLIMRQDDPMRGCNVERASRPIVVTRHVVLVEKLKDIV